MKSSDFESDPDFKKCVAIVAKERCLSLTHYYNKGYIIRYSILHYLPILVSLLQSTYNISLQAIMHWPLCFDAIILKYLLCCLAYLTASVSKSERGLISCLPALHLSH